MNVAAPASWNSINVTSDTSWSVSADVLWLMGSTDSGKGNESVAVLVLENTSTSPRTGRITFKAAGCSPQVCTVVQSPKYITNVSIDGPESISSAAAASYTCAASWNVGSNTIVTPTWTVSPATYASVSPAGVVTNKNTTTDDQKVTLKATCTVNDVTKTDTKAITLARKTLASIAIGGSTTVATGGTASYTCTASWSYGPTSSVTPTWNLSSTTYASVSTGGVVTNKNTTTDDKKVTLKATYTSGGVTRTSTKTVTLAKKKPIYIGIGGLPILR